MNGAGPQISIHCFPLGPTGELVADVAKLAKPLNKQLTSASLGQAHRQKVSFVVAVGLEVHPKRLTH